MNALPRVNHPAEALALQAADKCLFIKPIHGLGQNAQLCAAIHLMPIDRLTSIATRVEVADGSKKFVSQGAAHVFVVASWGSIVLSSGEMGGPS